jgi:hypothetical protein
MQKNYRRSTIPDLRKKSEYRNQLSLRYINIGACVFIGLIIAVLIISVVTVAAMPNSNFPSNI